jgi:hypothetical protein
MDQFVLTLWKLAELVSGYISPHFDGAVANFTHARKTRLYELGRFKHQKTRSPGQELHLEIGG